MTQQITLEIPVGAFSALHADPIEFAQEMRQAAAVKWYELGRISQGKAAEIAGVSRVGFHDLLARFKVSPVQMTVEELTEEINRV